MGRNGLMAMLAALFLIAAPTAATGGLVPAPRTYRPLDLFGNGYKDKLQKDGTWRIVANSRPFDGPGFAKDMALYRAAELTTAAGHSHFQILEASGTIGTGMYVRGRETIKLIVRPTDSAAPPTECRAKQPRACVTLEAAETIARIGPTLRR
jgi:hypothetical protein